MDLFLIKKIIGQLIMPLPIILLLLILAVLLFNRTPRFSKLLLTFSTCFLFLLSFKPVSDTVIKPLEAEYPLYAGQQIDYIVILGCGHISEQTLHTSQQLQTCSLQRLVEGIRIAQLMPSALLITSGAALHDPMSNAVVVKNAAIELGINANRIVVEKRPKDTRQESVLISDIVKDKPFALITNANHMPRAMNFFLQQGTQPIAAPTGYFAKDNGTPFLWTDYFPRSHHLTKSESAWYETLGLLWQRILNVI